MGSIRSLTSDEARTERENGVGTETLDVDLTDPANPIPKTVFDGTLSTPTH
jgi:hypothetical protein